MGDSEFSGGRGDLLRQARAELLPPLADLLIVPAQLGETAAIRGAARRALTLIPATEGSHA